MLGGISNINSNSNKGKNEEGRKMSRKEKKRNQGQKQSTQSNSNDNGNMGNDDSPFFENWGQQGMENPIGINGGFPIPNHPLKKPSNGSSGLGLGSFGGRGGRINDEQFDIPVQGKSKKKTSNTHANSEKRRIAREEKERELAREREAQRVRERQAEEERKIQRQREVRGGKVEKIL